jgi:hypothetical protein
MRHLAKCEQNSYPLIHETSSQPNRSPGKSKDFVVHTVLIPAEQRVILDNISWSTYLAILKDAESCRGRIAYDRGVLEIMSPSKVHEHIKRLIGRMIEAYERIWHADSSLMNATMLRTLEWCVAKTISI